MDVNDHTLDETTGRLVMKYRGLKDFDVNLFQSMDLTRIVHLDVSYNNLQHLPAELELLSNLEYLNCSWNRLQALPSIIGKFVSFRTLNASKNRMKQIPNELGQCFWLKYLDLSDNQLQVLPESLCNCTRLRVIYLQNNQLVTLPYSLARLRGYGILEEMNVSGNPQLKMIPESVQTQSDVILWTLSIFYENESRLDNISRKINEYHTLFHDQERRLVLERERYAQLLQQENQLLAERESVKWFLMVLDYKEKCKIFLQRRSSEITALFALRTFSRTQIDPIF